MQDYIVILNDGVFMPDKAIKTAQLLADGFKKAICFLTFTNNDTLFLPIGLRHKQWLQEYALQGISVVKKEPVNRLNDVLTEMEASFLLVEISSDSEFFKIQSLLHLCRPLRIPYIFVTPITQPVNLQRALVPVGFLTEEKEKGIFASKLARFCHTVVTLLQANDYGTRAAISVGQIKTMFDKLEVACEIRQAGKDSFKVQEEAAFRASQGEADIVLVTASREYGLDDILFGPPERKIIARSTVPVMVINPRADLYVLCD
jgi:hypothetical protein